MADIFDVRADAYYLAPSPPPPTSINPKRMTALPDRGDDGGAIYNHKRRRGYNNRDDGDGLRGGAANKNNKSKHVSD